MKWLRPLIFAAALGALGPAPSAWAQKQKIYGDPASDMLVVGASTVGGAVLGLSTLSFVEEPEDHLKNILVGGAIGLIAGVGVVAYLQADTSQTKYKQEASFWPRANSPHKFTPGVKRRQGPRPYQVSYSFRF